MLDKHLGTPLCNELGQKSVGVDVRGRTNRSPGQVLLSNQRAKIGRGLVAAQAFRDGQVILDLSSLWFDRKDALMAFFRSNEHFHDRTVAIPDIRASDGARMVWASMVGVGQFVQDFRGIKARPSAKIVFRPGSGFNVGALQLVTETKNKAGISKGMEILLHYGACFRYADAEVLPSPAKKFKGALDALFSAQAVESSDQLAVASGQRSRSPSWKRPRGDAKLEPCDKSDGADKAEAAGATNATSASDHIKPSEGAQEREQAAASSDQLAVDSGEQDLVAAVAEFQSPPMMLRYAEATGVLSVLSKALTNKKIPKDFVYKSFGQGVALARTKSAEGQEAGVLFKIDVSSVVFSSESQSLLTMKKLIKETPDVCALFGFATFCACVQFLREDNIRFCSAGLWVCG